MAHDQRSKPASVAIIGMSCRLPGGVSTLDDLWTMLSRGRSGWGKIPEDRFSSHAYYHPNPQKRGCFNTESGYFLDHDLAKFDAPFFNITQQEAMAMDPQQRLLLECAFEALENAGLSKEAVAGSNMGVFVGGALSDYHHGTLQNLDAVPMFDVTGNHMSVLSGRISHCLDLRGPCFTLDTACSSGLYALHAAVQSIRSGECDSALVSGCHLHFQPDDWVSMSMSSLFSEHGKTFAFDHRAKSGFARGEGVGCLVIKRLDLATRDNDRVKSIIVNTGTNQDGRTVGLSNPSGAAQEQLIRDVYTRAGVSVDDVGFVEAHGTGTKAGDPIEARALYNVFGHGRTKRHPLYIGSVKTNVGHLENASGIVSIIKATMMLDKGFILPNVNFEKANESIPLDEWNMKVPTSLRSWPPKKPLLSVNNFGFGGSNAHCVLERPGLCAESFIQEKSDGQHKLFVLSAQNEVAARQRAKQAGIYAEQHPEVFQKALVRDLAYTLGERRSHMPWRIAITASSCKELVEALNKAEAKPDRASKQHPTIAFVFTGQGAQWYAMGRELMTSHAVFADVMKAADACLGRLGADFSLLEELGRDKNESLVNSAHISQPACTAVQLGLVQLLSSWGVRPMAVVGHSSGEIAAAFATGSISLNDAMCVAYFRGQATLQMKALYPQFPGAMLAVGASPTQVRTLIKTKGILGATVACENSPGSTTVSGDAEAVDEVAAEVDKLKLFNRRLRVDIAYHSFHMDFVADDYHAAISHLGAEAGNGVRFFSSLRGSEIESSSISAQYWTENLVKPVLFSKSVENLCAEVKPSVLVEIGPHGALEGAVKQILRNMEQKTCETRYLASLVRGEDATTSMLRLAGKLFVMGQGLDFSKVNAVQQAERPRLIDDLAPYPWTYERYWSESRDSRQRRIKPFARHDLVGLLVDSSNDLEHTWRNVLRTDDIPWLRDHQMQSLTTFPLAGYLCMVTEAVTQRAALRRLELDRFCMREIQASAPLMMNDGDGYEVVLTLRRYSEGTRSYSDEWDEFTISSWMQDRGWLEHCRGLVSARRKSTAGFAIGQGQKMTRSRLESASQCCKTRISTHDFYSELAEKGAQYGPMFQIGDTDNFRGCGEYSMTEVRVPDTCTIMPFNYETPSILPAAFLDRFLHTTFAILGAGRGGMPTLYMPSAIKQVEFGKDIGRPMNGKVQVVCQGRPTDSATLTPVDFDVDVWESTKSAKPLMSFTGFRMSPVMDRIQEVATPRSLCFKLEWEPFEKTSQMKQGISSNDETTNRRVNEVPGTPCGDGNQDHVKGNVMHADGIEHGAMVNGEASGHVDADASDEREGTAWEKMKTPIAIVTERDSTDVLVASLTDRLTLTTGSTVSICSLERLSPGDTLCICLDELDEPLTARMNGVTFDRLQKMLLGAAAVMWVSSGSFSIAKHPDKAMTLGLLRSIRSESQKTAAFLDLDPDSRLDACGQADLILQALKQSLGSEHETGPRDFEFSEQDGKLFLPRVVEDAAMDELVQRKTQPAGVYLQPFEQKDRRFRIAVGTLGALDSLYFQDEAVEPLAHDEIEVKIAATGVNFKDVVISMGQVASPYVGVECSGTVARVGAGVETLAIGTRVCAMTWGAYGTFTRCKASSATEIPDDMSMEVAASIPVVYCTAYYALAEVARLEAGETVLIHAAAGGVGQAAIQLAQMMGAQVYGTVGSAQKKRFLMDRYKIAEDHILYSRDAAFGPAIRDATRGRGVDVVINSLAGDLLRETWESLAPFGRFVEIGKRDIVSNSRLDMAQFEHNVTFSSVDLTVVAMQRPRIMQRVLKQVMSLIGRGCVCPVGPLSVMGISEVEGALRMMQGGKSVGKIVVVPRAGDQVKATHQPLTNLLSSEATYVIVGGTGGLGRSMAHWMAQRGAGHVVLLSRSGGITDDVVQLREKCRVLGARIHVKACDASDEASVQRVVRECEQSLPRIRGIVHAAMVLRDILFERMTFDDFNQVVQSKVSGTWNLHHALSKTHLDFFILLSSVAGIVGNKGQAAYAAANTFLDAFVRYRHLNGLAATALDLAAVTDAGYLSHDAHRRDEVLATISGSAMVEAEVLALLESTIAGESAIVGKSAIVGREATPSSHCITGLAQGPAPPPFYASDARFSRLVAAATHSSHDQQAAVSVRQEVCRAATYDEALRVVTQRVWDKLRDILVLQTHETEADERSTVRAYGLDSLNAIELRNWIGKELGAHLQVLELLTTGTLRDLGALVLKKSKLEEPRWVKTEG